MELFEIIEQTVLSKQIDEIISENLRNFWINENCSKMTYSELCQKYAEEEYNELDRELEYFEQNISDFKQNLHHYKRVYNLLNDDESRKVFANMIAAKIFMDTSYINNAFKLTPVYFSKDIFSFSNDIYIDCGGYDGDTASEFVKCNPDVQQVYIFEGIPELATKCRLKMEQECPEAKVHVFQNVVFDKECELSLVQGIGNGDSRIGENGEIKVKAVTLDDSLTDDVTFIKMDIEGSEKEAIKGAARIIRTKTPKMAICIYHLKDDFWKIPELILSINSKYHFKVRQHDPVSFSETVLYCIPPNMPTPKGEYASVSKAEKDLIEYKKDKVWYLKQLRNQKDEIAGYSKWCKELKQNIDYYENKAESNQLRIKELETWTEELEKAKEYLENQINSKDSRIKELVEWTNELDKTKKHLENQINFKDSRIKELVEWTNELDSAKKFLESQVNYKDLRIKELENWIKELENTKKYFEDQITLKDVKITELEKRNQA